MHHAITCNSQSNINIQVKHEKEVEEINKLITERINNTIYKSISFNSIPTDLTISYYKSKGFKYEFAGMKSYISWDLDLNIGEEILYNSQYYTIDWIYGSKICLINKESKEKIIINEEDLIGSIDQ